MKHRLQGDKKTLRLRQGYAETGTPHALICHPRKRGFKSTARRWRARDKCFLTAYGRVKSGLKPAVKNRAAHGGEECAARMVKTKADALGIGGQTPIC